MGGRPVNLLAIETATDAVGAALIRDGAGAAERVHLGGRAHAELLLPAIEEVCALAGCTVSDLGAVAVDVGPGLFTGLRVGVGTAKALAFALGIGVVGVSSLDTLAAAALGRAGDEHSRRVLAVVDARRGEVFAAAYRFDEDDGTPGGDTGRSVVDPAVVRDDRADPLAPEALAGWLAKEVDEAGSVLLVGDGAVRYRELLGAVPGADLSIAATLSSPPPAALGRLALARLEAGEAPAGAADLVPDYRRHADARIHWEQRPGGAAG